LMTSSRYRINAWIRFTWSAKIQCGRDLLRATPWLQLLLEVGSGIGSTMNATFDPPPRVAAQLELLVQHLAYLSQMSTSVQKPRPPGGYGGYDRS
jgi:hypothetical protein